jgi:hypothetical protein
MYWVSVIAKLLKIDMTLAEKIYDEMYSFDFSESSDAQIRKYAKLTLACMKA